MAYQNIIDDLLLSLICKDGNVNNTPKILDWIKNLNEMTKVSINEISLNDDSYWYYDKEVGEILNKTKSFFSIAGVQYFINEKFIYEQPIIIQNEIGYLGFIIKKINGVINFLMQAKIEPGNINCVQISPTIQATKSNFSKVHGGRLPFYFEEFEQAYNKKNTTVIYDQIQSEQGSRFFGKRNRNIIILINDDIPIYKNYMWMTLGQIKELLKIDNLVNMDTRTVLSGLPIKKLEYFYNQELIEAYGKLNEYKMYHDVKKKITPIHKLQNWNINKYGVFPCRDDEFCIKYYSISIEGREVQTWSQPLFKSMVIGVFILFTRVYNKKRQFLIKTTPEIGCFDKVEYGPTIQSTLKAPTDSNTSKTLLEIFKKYFSLQKGILHDILLSEEGGRFYHEQNRNIILEIDCNEILQLSQEYIWVTYQTLYTLNISNNNLNIQLRNLISLLDKTE